MKSTTFFVILFILVQFSNGFNLTNVLHEEIVNLNTSNELSKDCYSDLLLMTYGLEHFEEWALRMVDASSKMQSGIGVLSADFGQFDECIEAESGNGEIAGKYCLGLISLKEPPKQLEHLVKAKNGLEQIQNLMGSKNAAIYKIIWPWAGCLPKSCSASDFDYIYNTFLEYSIPKIELKFTDALCSTKSDNTEFSIGAVITIVFFALIIITMIMETCYDVYCQQQEQEPNPLWIAFSVYTNSAKLFKMSNKNQLQCLDGLKFYSMLWVVMGHTFSNSLYAPIANYMDILHWFDKVRSMLIVSATLSVDTFFVVGGTLVAYVYLQAMEKGTKFNVFIYYLHRYIRLTPALGVLTLVTATIYPYLGSGPFWNSVRQSQEMCQKNWWSTILYIQNYATFPDLCLGHSWYLNIDMQLYLISPLILYGLKKYSIGTIIGLAGVIIATCVTNFFINWKEHYSAVLSNINDPNLHYMTDFYMKTHTRAGPWLLGIIVGYFIFEVKQSRLNFRPHKILNIILWICSLALLLTCIFIGHDSLRTADYSVWGNSLHIALVRQLWTVGVSWIIISCICGYGGPVNWFLSFPFYQVFNRFAYSIYLVHFMFMILWYASTRTPIHFSEMVMTYYFWGNLGFTCLLAYFWVLAFESPVITLEKIILGPLINPKRKNQA